MVFEESLSCFFNCNYFDIFFEIWIFCCRIFCVWFVFGIIFNLGWVSVIGRVVEDSDNIDVGGGCVMLYVRFVFKGFVWELWLVL